MTERKAATAQDAAAFQVKGITCLDCAQKFEKAIGALQESPTFHLTQ